MQGRFVSAGALPWPGGNFRLQWTCLLKGRGHAIGSLSFHPQGSRLTVWGHPCHPGGLFLHLPSKGGRRGLSRGLRLSSA